MMNHPPSPSNTASPPTSPAYTPTSPVATSNVQTQPITNNNEDTDSDTEEPTVIATKVSPKAEGNQRTQRLAFTNLNGEARTAVDVEMDGHQTPYTIMMKNGDGSTFQLQPSSSTEPIEPPSKKRQFLPPKLATPRREPVPIKERTNTFLQKILRPAPSDMTFQPIKLAKIFEINQAAEKHTIPPGYFNEQNSRWRLHIREALHQCEFAQTFPIERPWHFDIENFEYYTLDQPFILDEVRIGTPQNHHMARMFSIQDAHRTKQEAELTNEVMFYQKQHWFESNIYQERYHKRRVDLTFSQTELDELGFDQTRPWVYEHTFATQTINLNDQIVTFFMVDPHPFEVFMLLHIRKLTMRKQQMLFSMPDEAKFSVFGSTGLRDFAKQSIIPIYHMEYDCMRKTKHAVHGF
jgi:hypothetical protein